MMMRDDSKTKVPYDGISASDIALMRASATMKVGVGVAGCFSVIVTAIAVGLHYANSSAFMVVGSLVGYIPMVVLISWLYPRAYPVYAPTVVARVRFILLQLTILNSLSWLIGEPNAVYEAGTLGYTVMALGYGISNVVSTVGLPVLFRDAWWPERQGSIGENALAVLVIFLGAAATMYAFQYLFYQHPELQAVSWFGILLSNVMSVILVGVVDTYRIARGVIIQLNLWYVVLYSWFIIGVATLPGQLLLTLRTHVRGTAANIVIVVVWQLGMVVMHFVVKKMAERALTKELVSAFMMPVILSADAFVETVYLTVRIASVEFWVLELCNFVLLVLRAAELWDDIDAFIVLQFGNVGQLISAAAQAFAGDTDGIGDAVDRRLSRLSNSLGRAAEAERSRAERRAKFSARHASMCVVSEVMSTLVLLLVVVFEYFLELVDASLVRTITFGMSQAQRREAIVALCITLGMQALGMRVSHHITTWKHRHSANGLEDHDRARWAAELWRDDAPFLVASSAFVLGRVVLAASQVRHTIVPGGVFFVNSEQ